MPSSIFRRSSASLTSTKVTLLVTLLAGLFVASSWNLMSFSKINIHIGDIHHSPTPEQGGTIAPSEQKSSMPTADPTMQTMGEGIASGGTLVPGTDNDSPLFKIQAGIREIASAGIDPFSIALVSPTMALKKSELEKLTPFYQLLITQNKDIKITEPPPPAKPKEDPKAFDPSAGGVAVETIPVIPNPIDGIKLSGISYMPKRSFAMLNVSGQPKAAIVTQGETIALAGQAVKIVSISRGKVGLCWLNAPKGVTATRQLTIPDIIGYQASSSASSGGGGGPSSGGGPSGPSGSNPPSGPSGSGGGGIPSGKGPAAAHPSNSPEDIEKLVKEAMKP